MIKVVVTGAAGRMGQRIVANACADQEVKIVGAVEAPGQTALGKDAGELAGCGACGVVISDSLEKVLVLADLVVDFSHVEATVPNLKMAARLKKAAVVGTTGHRPEQIQEIERIARDLPVVMAANMSVGVNVLWKITEEAATVLGKIFNVSVREVHHIHKKDKPSGTALEIVRRLAKALRVAPERIPVESIREGEVVGDHSVLFSGAGESLEITHRAVSRDTFALGALRAAKWIVGKKPGLYSMVDVLELK